MRFTSDMDPAEVAKGTVLQRELLSAWPTGQGIRQRKQFQRRKCREKKSSSASEGRSALR